MNQEFQLEQNGQTSVTNLTIWVNDVDYHCNRSIAVKHSPLIFNLLSNEKSKKELTLDFSDDFHQFYLIEKLFVGERIILSKDNIDFLIEVSEFLQIQSLIKKVNEFSEYLDDLNQIIDDDEGIQIMIDLEKEIFGLAENTMDLAIELIEKLDFMKAVCQLIINACFSRPKSIPLYLQLVTRITQLKLHKKSPENNSEEENEEQSENENQTESENKNDNENENQNENKNNNESEKQNENEDENQLGDDDNDEQIPFIKIFINTMLDPIVEECRIKNEYVELRKEVEFILRWLIDNGLIEFDDILRDDLKFYSFYLIDFMEKKNPKIIEVLSEIYKGYYTSFFRNIEELKKNDWEIHKKLVKEGVNNYEIAIAIQNDDKDKLQQIVAQPKYNNVELCKEKIPCSVYERCTFIDKKTKIVNRNPTLIQYAAFFGSINCFKFLIMNDPKFAPNNFKFIKKEDKQNENEQNNNELLVANNNTEAAAAVVVVDDDDNENNEIGNPNLNPFRNDPNYKNLAKYAVASGNPEIIHIIEQKGCSFDDTLEYAFDYAHSDIFDWIRMNKYVNSDQLPLSKFLTKCVHQMHITLLVELIEEGINPNDSKLITAAVEEDNILLLDFLLKIKGIEVNENNIAFFNFNQIRYDMQKIVDIQQMTSSSSNNLDPPLIIACNRRKKEIVERLLNFPSTDVNIRGRHYKTALATVALNGDVEIAKMLLNHKDIIINIFEEKRKTPFYIACENNNFEIVKLLASRSETDINEHTREDEKLTPLHISILNGNEQIASFLLSLDGINVNAQTKEGKTPLHQASQRRKNITIVKLLLNHKDISLDLLTLDHLSPLHYACGKSSLEIVKMLYETGKFDINYKCEEILKKKNFFNTIIKIESGIFK